MRPWLILQRAATWSCIFLSAPASQHIQDLTANPRASATIFPEVRTWQEIRGLQLRGRVDEIPLSFQKLSGWGYYLAKFPFVGGLSSEVAKNRFYVFTPNWICLTDNRVHFGYKREWADEELVGLD